MLLLIVWIAVAVVAVVVLGSIGFGLMGAVTRLRREVTGAATDLQPVLTDVQAALAAVERTRSSGSAGR